MSKDWDPYEGVDSWDEMTSIERLRYVHADDEGDTARVEVERMAEQLRELREVAHQIVGYSRTVQALDQPTLRKIAQNANDALSRSKGTSG